MKGILEAVREGNVGLLRRILSVEARVDEIHKDTIVFGKNVVSVRDYTALMVACAEGFTGGAYLLLEAGADPNRKAAEGFTALHLAALTNQSEIVALLARFKADLNARMKPAETPLLSALSMGSHGAALALIQAGCDVQVKDGFVGDTPLHRIVSVKRTDPEATQCILALLSAGADVNGRNSMQQTPLHYAAAIAPESVRLLLDHGGDVRAEDFMKRTPLQNAFKNAETVRILLEAGSDPNHSDPLGRTVLMDAVRNKQQDVIRELVKSGADVNKKTEDGTTALSLAAESGEETIYRLLQESGSKEEFSVQTLNELLCNACQSGDAARVAAFLARGADPNSTREWKPALLLAIEGSHAAVAQTLVAAGADVNRSTPGGVTPLHGAAMRESTDMMQLLLKAGAEVDRADEEGRTPLMCACEGGGADAIRLLIQSGADVHKKSKNEMVSLLIAARHGHADAAGIILQAGGQHPLDSHFLEIPEFAGRLEKPAYQKAISDLTKLCGAKPLVTPPAFSGAVFFDLSETPKARAAKKKLEAMFLREIKAEQKVDAAQSKTAAARMSEMHAVDAAIRGIQDRAQQKYLERECLLLFVHQLSGNKLALLPTNNPFAAVAWLGPHPKGPVAMIEFLVKLADGWKWQLLGCSSDELQLQFAGQPDETAELARRLYSLGSHEKGVVENGIVRLTENMSELAERLAVKDTIARLWWD